MNRTDVLDPRRIREVMQPLTGESSDLNAVVASAADITYVLLGEATHGTHEFYITRAEITKRLIREHGFRAVAVTPTLRRAQSVTKCSTLRV